VGEGERGRRGRGGDSNKGVVSGGGGGGRRREGLGSVEKEKVRVGGREDWEGWWGVG